MVRTTDFSKKRLGLKWRSNTLFILSTVAIGLFTDLFLYGLVVPILPFILRDRLSIPHSHVQAYSSILLASYAGASILFSIPAGIIADKLPSRKLPFLVGLVVLLASTIMLYLGQSIAELILARIFQGISCATVWIVGLALVLDTVGSKKLGVTIGSMFSFIGAGNMAAPVIGGLVYEKAGVGAVFAIGFGLLAVDFIMRLLVIEKKFARRYEIEDHTQDDSQENNDEEGAERETEEEAAEEEDSPFLQNAEAEKYKIPEDQPTIILKFPMLYCLFNSRILMSQVATLMQATLFAVFDATIPTEAHDLFFFDSLKIGLLFLPLALPYLVLSPIGGIVVDKFGVKPAATIGFAFLSVPLALLRLPHQGGTVEIAEFCVFVGLCGVGLAIVSAPSFVEASVVVELYHKHNPETFGEDGPYAQLYAINSIAQSLGLTLGPLVAGVLRVRIGYGNMNAVFAGMCLVVSGLCFVYLGGKPKMLRRGGEK
jgi:MFS family permease